MIDELSYKLMDDGWFVGGKWLQVWRKDGNDGITWDQLQEVKDLVFGEEATAVEIFPASSQVVNLLNVRHLWVLSDVKLPNLKEILEKNGVFPVNMPTKREYRA